MHKARIRGKPCGLSQVPAPAALACACLCVNPRTKAAYPVRSARQKAAREEGAALRLCDGGFWGAWTAERAPPRAPGPGRPRVSQERRKAGVLPPWLAGHRQTAALVCADCRRPACGRAAGSRASTATGSRAAPQTPRGEVRLRGGPSFKAPQPWPPANSPGDPLAPNLCLGQRGCWGAGRCAALGAARWGLPGARELRASSAPCAPEPRAGAPHPP